MWQMNIAMEDEEVTMAECQMFIEIVEEVERS